MLKFNTLLQAEDFEIEKVFLLRHQDERLPPYRLYQAWRSKPEHFMAYQQGQKWKNRFDIGSSVASFVVEPVSGGTLFVGMFDIVGLSRLAGPFDDPLLGKMPPEDRSWHDMKLSERMQDFIGKLVIDWGKARQWRRRAQNQNKAVLEIRPQLKEEPFPHYVNFLCRLGDLNNIYQSWRARLEERKGIYLLTFEDGKQYVGSAIGERGFWQRWNNYLDNGHGGNRILIRDQRDARKAMVSILEVSGSAEIERDIINQEMLWQRKLGARATQLESE